MKEVYIRAKAVNGTYVYAPIGTADTYGTILIDNESLKYYNDPNGKTKLRVNGAALVDENTLTHYTDNDGKTKLKVNSEALVGNDNTLYAVDNKLYVNIGVINRKLDEDLYRTIDLKLNKTAVVDNIGGDTNKVMSQYGVTLQLTNKLDKTAVVQETGTSTTKVMSQNAISKNFASLVNGKVPASQLPSYVDDVLEYVNKDAFPKPGETSKIYVDKSTNLTYRWSSNSNNYIMIGGGDLNIENGTGLDSIVQKYSGQVDETHFGNISEGESGAIFGEANSNSGNRAMVSGKMNRNSAPNSLIIGLGNGRGIGATPNIDALSGEQLFVFGTENSVSNGDGNAVLGNENTLSDIRYTTIIGRGNIINNTSQYEGKCVVGRYNNQKRDTMFEVGVGDYNNRVNGLEVYKDRRVKVYGEPTESNDAVRKKELDTKLSLSEFSVLTQSQVDLLF